MSTTLHVELGERGYDIRVGTDLLSALVLPAEPGTQVLIVSDSNVDPLHGGRLEQTLRGQGLRVRRVAVPAGEASKNLDQVRALYEAALAGGMDRSSIVAALGGGMVGDLAGFMAATFLRGIRLVQIPTSLVAMVDSSVGGKTGVNLSRGKNLVGAFHQPLQVVADLSLLQTLPRREYVSGLAEAVKYGVIWDADLFRTVEENGSRILERDSGLLEEIVTRCCAVKAEIVSMDERESGVRAILNFGHTLGHALEQVSGFGPWLHGEAVAAGMVFAAELSVEIRGFPPEARDRLSLLLGRLGLPTGAGEGLSWPALRAAMAADKKTVQAVPRFVLAERIGAVVFGCEVGDAALARVFAKWSRAQKGG